MKQRIIDNIDHPEILEELYRENKRDFAPAFIEISKDYNTDLVRFWSIRLATEQETASASFLKIDLIVVIILSLITGFLVKLPDLFSQINEDLFYERDLGIIVFNGLILFTFWVNKIYNKKSIIIYSSIIIVMLLFLNILPSNIEHESDSINLALIHSPLFLWCLFGLAFVSYDYKNISKRINFIRFNGELLIMTGLILIAGGILTGLTIGLFSVIDIHIEEFYMKYIAVFGGVAAPIISFYLIRIYPTITNKIAPVIARVFTPLVLITLSVYLVVLVLSESKILEDRELLLLFNIMLIAVMAIIVFSISELDKSKKKDINVFILFSLAALAIVINTIALIAIVTRVTYGLTPNRTVVLVSNVLIFINLILIAKHLFKAYYKSNQLDSVEETVANYLTIYTIWTVIVIFILPFVFSFK